MRSVIVFVFLLFCSSLALALSTDVASMHGAFIGMKQDEFLKIYSKDNIRDFRHEGSEDWLTYDQPLNDPFHQLITFLLDLFPWKLLIHIIIVFLSTV